MSPTSPELDRNPSCTEERQEGLSVALDRALTVAEHVYERMSATRRWMDFFRCVFWIAMVGISTLVFLLVWSIITRLVSSESVVIPFGIVDIVGYVVNGTVSSVVGFFLKGEWDRVKAAYARDSRYIGKIVEILREAVKPDNFATRLEWHLFQLRIARFDIGQVNSDLDRDNARAIELLQMALSARELGNLPQEQINPANQSPQKTTATP